MGIRDWSSDVCSSDLGSCARERTCRSFRRSVFWEPLASRMRLTVSCWVLLFWRMYFSVRRSEEHTPELQSLMRISYAVFCLKKKKKKQRQRRNEENTNKNHTTIHNTHHATSHENNKQTTTKH